MKNKIVTLIVLLSLSTSLFVSCKPSTEKEIEAKENVQEAREDLHEANEDLLEAKKEATAAEWKAFKASGDSLIDKNDQRIAELKLKIKKSNNSMDAMYKKNIETLENKNQDLKAKMKTYKNDANADWKSFKTEFNHDMKELGNALKDFNVDNKK